MKLFFRARASIDEFGERLLKRKGTVYSANLNSFSDERVVNNVVRHEYRILNDDEKAQMKNIKDMGRNLIEYLDCLGKTRELSIAKTKVEEAVMWGVKSITK